MSYDMALWEMIRASGLAAYVLLSLAVAFGIAVRVRGLDWVMKRAWTFEAHQVVSVLALTFTGLHVLLLLANHHVPFGATAILVPFAASWRPLAAALGTLSLYLVALLVVSSYTRSFIGQKTWRAIHFGGFLAWAMALAHGIGAGSDSAVPWVQYLYLGTGAIVIFLILFRLLEASAPADGSHRTSVKVWRRGGSGWLSDRVNGNAFYVALRQPKPVRKSDARSVGEGEWGESTSGAGGEGHTLARPR